VAVEGAFTIDGEAAKALEPGEGALPDPALGNRRGRGPHPLTPSPKERGHRPGFYRVFVNKEPGAMR